LLPSGSQIGGAPGNFACHARALGARACVVTRIGDDTLGELILNRFQEKGIAGGTMQVDGKAPTGTVKVTLSGGSPTYEIQENVAWDWLEAAPAALKAVHEADAICFGSLAQRSEVSRASIRKLVAAASSHALRVFDVNLRQNYYSREVLEKSLELANMLKLNEAELVVLADVFGLSGSTRRKIEQLTHKFGLQLVALTRGADGSLLLHNGRWSDCGSAPMRIVDTVGAGDAFTAALVMGLLGKMDLDEINLLASEVARHVCSCVGATPPLPKEFSERFAARGAVPETGVNPTRSLAPET
jgi:fructokinase